MGAMTASTAHPDHPRTRSMESWRGRKAVLASRGEVDGPRVAECDAALAWWRIRTRLIADMDISEQRAESLLDLIVPQADAEPPDAAAAEHAEPVEADAPHDDPPAPDSPASVTQRQPDSASDAAVVSS